MQDEPEGALAPDIAITGGSPSATEIAAVTAVLSAVLEELADAHGRVERTGQSAWARSQRPLRTPLHPGPGAWGGFSG